MSFSNWTRCADCPHDCEEGESCIRDQDPDEDRVYEAERDRRICEADG